jgi:hypothetical protein
MPRTFDMNGFLRSQRGTRPRDGEEFGRMVNRQLRETRYGPGPPFEPEPQPAAVRSDPRTVRGQLLDTAAAGVRDDEPMAGIDPAESWETWVWSRRVAPLLDQDGRLPGEAGYNPTRTGPANPAFDLDIAVAARRRRWEELA